MGTPAAHRKAAAYLRSTYEMSERRACREIGRRSALLPLGDGLLFDPVAMRQRPQALLTMLYRSTDCLSRRGAPVE
jgi:hypothetical protein